MFTQKKIILTALILTSLFLLFFGWGHNGLLTTEKSMCSPTTNTDCFKTKFDMLSHYAKNIGIVFLLVLTAVLQYILLTYKDAVKNKTTDQSHPAVKMSKAVDNTLYLISTNKPFAPKELTLQQAKDLKIKPSHEVDTAFKHQYFYKPVKENNTTKLILVGSN